MHSITIIVPIKNVFPHLTANADDHATDTGRIHAIGSLAKDAAPQLTLPAAVFDAA